MSLQTPGGGPGGPIVGNGPTTTPALYKAAPSQSRLFTKNIKKNSDKCFWKTFSLTSLYSTCFASRLTSLGFVPTALRGHLRWSRSDWLHVRSQQDGRVGEKLNNYNILGKNNLAPFAFTFSFCSSFKSWNICIWASIATKTFTLKSEKYSLNKASTCSSE